MENTKTHFHAAKTERNGLHRKIPQKKQKIHPFQPYVKKHHIDILRHGISIIFPQKGLTNAIKSGKLIRMIKYYL